MCHSPGLFRTIIYSIQEYSLQYNLGLCSCVDGCQFGVSFCYSVVALGFVILFCSVVSQCFPVCLVTVCLCDNYGLVYLQPTFISRVGFPPCSVAVLIVFWFHLWPVILCLFKSCVCFVYKNLSSRQLINIPKLPAFWVLIPTQIVTSCLN